MPLARSSQRLAHALIERVAAPGGVCVLRFKNTPGDDKAAFAWGTRVCEHRLNEQFVGELEQHVDDALR